MNSTTSHLQKSLSSIRNAVSSQTGLTINDIEHISIPEGTYIADNIDIAHRWIELAGEPSKEKQDLKTELISSSKSEVNRNSDDKRRQNIETCMFSLTNSTLSMKWIHISLVDQSPEGRPQMNEATSPRLAIVSRSILTISSSRIEVSPWTSAIVISGSALEESGRESSVVIQNSKLWNDVGSMRGVVETSSFASFVGSVWVSIVGCSFDSSRILGNDGIGLSLTRTPRKNVESVGKLSSSLIGCSFVNVSSIGCSHVSRLRHLDQKMLGCVVSLTSSHLSGSTIRDVNTGGSVLCSNSSFSSLLSSPNADPEPTADPSGIYSSHTIDDDKVYYFNESSGVESTSTNFENCRFSGTKYQQNVCPLKFKQYLGSISILSCSFTGIAQPDEDNGALSIEAVQIDPYSPPPTNHVKVELCNFTQCSAKNQGGGLFLHASALITVTRCRCEKCSIDATDEYAYSGGMCIHFQSSSEATVSDLYFEECTSTRNAGGLGLESIVSKYTINSLSFKACSAHHPTSTIGKGGGMMMGSAISDPTFFSVSFLKFEDCSADYFGGGLHALTLAMPLSFEDCEFIRCTLTNPDGCYERGGGLYTKVYENAITVKNCQFIDCSSAVLGGAMFGEAGRFVMSECLVKNCHSGSTGTVCIVPIVTSTITLKNILFVGNTVSDTPTYFDQHESMKGAVQFADFLIEDENNKRPSNFSIIDCWTTTAPNSVGMYTTKDPGKANQKYNYVYLSAFRDMGPFLTHQVEASHDIESWKFDLKMKGKVPLDLQIYEATVKETGGNSELTGQLQFVNGVGSLLPSSNLKMKFSTAYTITKIVGVVPSSSESNAIDITAEAWAFNLAATTSFLSFTTPAQPPILLASTAHLTDASQPFAFVILMFDRQVSGSYDIVVEEEGKDVTITVPILGSSMQGKSENFRVVGDDRLLTHDTTYTIKSLSPTPGTEDTTTPVGMIDTVNVYIPKSSYLPPSTEGTVFVARGGSDSIDECGGEDSPCRTVWTGQICGKGKKGEWLWVLVRGEAEMGEGFWILGNVGMTLSSESLTQRSRVVIGRSSFSSNDGIVSISSATVQVTNLNVIVPSSEERSSSGWVFVVDSEGDLEMSSIGVIGEGEIGVGLAKVKNGIGRFTSVLMSSGSFGSGVGMIVGEGKWNPISMLICDFVVRDTTTSNAPLISFSSLLPESSFSMKGSRFQKTRRMIGSSSLSLDGDGVIEVSTAQSRTEISDCVFESSGVVDGTGTITRSALHITLNSSSASSCSLAISSCLFLDSHTTLPLSGSLHIRVVSGHTSVVFQDSLFESTTPNRLWTSFSSGIACLDWTRGRVGSPSSDLNGALIEYWDGLPIVVRRRGVFSNCKLVISKKS
ncbi:hypothetical protein BLNAU_16309 [Blattamonas nauphoetae]|uniref:Right handed beta helix domain-containing protein n=1 Tax=Blattamonas nauphoetae TaxID=2049346 RepID=A0ABQ9XD31_9EUKA|nr:hypothetical protein BLNAU_16309 [Blattamonas nauphoetae]